MSKSRGGLKVSESTEHFEAGDYVVGAFNDLGRKIEDGAAVGGEKTVSGIAAMIAKHASTHGEPLPTQPVVQQVVNKRGRKKKAPEPPPVRPQPVKAVVQEEKAPSEMRVTFHNDFGQITLQVEDVLQDDGDTAFALVFRNKNMVTFVPKVGEHLQLSIGGQVEKVFYPGTRFTWLDNQRVIMVLYRDR